MAVSSLETEKVKKVAVLVISAFNDADPEKMTATTNTCIIALVQLMTHMLVETARENAQRSPTTFLSR
jgi:hypothetical protein